MRIQEETMEALRAQVDAGQAEALGRFCIEAKHRQMSLRQMAETLDVSATTMSRVLNGKYEGDVAAVCDRAASVLRIWRDRGTFSRAVYVETSIAKKVKSACDFALTTQTPVILTGLSQMGKTTALQHYADTSDASVRLVRVSAATSLTEVIDGLCEAFGITIAVPNAAKKRNLFRTVNDRTLLMVDELHELVISTTKAQALRICEFFRELYDRTHCGLVLCGTDTLETDLLNGASRGWLDQIVQRSITVRLPRRITEADLKAVTAAYGLSGEPSEAARAALRGMRMNILCLLLASARDVAAKKGLELSWELWLATKQALLG